jgi:drug/metabolite transporter (DMT)-like permease
MSIGRTYWLFLTAAFLPGSCSVLNARIWVEGPREINPWSLLNLAGFLAAIYFGFLVAGDRRGRGTHGYWRHINVALALVAIVGFVAFCTFMIYLNTLL